MGGFMNPVFGGNVLIRPAMRSPNYVAGVSGWSINRDGSAELNNLALRGTFNGTDYVINASGLFFYSGTPAAGNMSGSWAQAAGTDAFGNAYPAGIKIYSALGAITLDATDGAFQSTGSGGTIVSIEDGSLAWLAPGYYSNALIIQDLIRTHGSLYVSGGESVSTDVPSTLGIITAYGAPTVGSPDTYPRINAYGGNASVMCHQYVSGAVVKSDLTGDVAATWQAPSYSTGWAGTTTFGTISGGLGTLRYRYDGEDNLWLLGTVVASAGATTTIFNLPAAYRPKTNYAFPCAFISSGGVAGDAWCYVSTAGNLNLNSQLGSAATVGSAYTFNAKVPLGNLA